MGFMSINFFFPVPAVMILLIVPLIIGSFLPNDLSLIKLSR